MFISAAADIGTPKSNRSKHIVIDSMPIAAQLNYVILLNIGITESVAPSISKNTTGQTVPSKSASYTCFHSHAHF